MLRKAILLGLLLLLLFVGFKQIHAADSGTCAKPKVAVKLKDFDNVTYDTLIRQYPFVTKKDWVQRVYSNLLEQLRAKSPGVVFLPADPETEAEYVLEYLIALKACGRDIKIGELLTGTEACYWSHGVMISKPACGTEVGTLLAASVQNKDIFASITFFVNALGRLDTAIAEHERQRLIPPRGPRLNVKPSDKSISPLEDEREITIEALLTNCKGEPVFDKDKKRRYAVLAGPRESHRGQTKPSPERGDLPSGNEWYISPTEGGMVGLKYTLKKGIRPETAKLKSKACGLGAPEATEYGEIHIDGLEIRVKSQKSQLKPGEETQIDIEFLKVSVKGDKKPIPGRDIQLKIDGLKDGVIIPKDKVSTNAAGKALLTYMAGQNDRSVRITAFYQPQKYPDRAEGSAVVLVQEAKGDLAVQINGSLNWTGEDKDTKGTIASNFTIHGTMTLHKQKHGGDYEYYEIENLQMTYSHHAEFHSKKPDKNCPDTLFFEVHGKGSAPIQNGRIIIRYPREKSGSRKQGELDIRLSSEPLHPKWKVCSERCKCQTEDRDFGHGIEVVDQKSPIARNQQEFSGSRSFGITDLRGAMNLISLGSLAWSFNDNESKKISTFPLLPKEIEKVVAERGGSIEQMRNLGIGINKEGSNGRLTWKIRKLKKSD